MKRNSPKRSHPNQRYSTPSHSAMSGGGVASATSKKTSPSSLLSLPIVRLATCSLNQWALDFAGNTKRIIQSIEIAKKRGCTYRVGPELEITGYSCEDHFYEMDTVKFAWKCLVDILNYDQGNLTQNILCDIGMPVLHNGVRYNCRVFCLNKKILLIRPKMWLADDGNYREERWFTPWSKHKIESLEEYVLSDDVAEVTGQKRVHFGVAILESNDASLASEVCEELFTPESPNIMWGLEGVDIVSNGSASHFQLGKRAYRHQLVKSATERNGGVYLYANMLGCDGNRLVFDGNAMIYKNGDLVATGEHLSFHEVEVVTADVNLDEVRAYRSAIVSRGIQADQRNIHAPRIDINQAFAPTFRFTAAEKDSFTYSGTQSMAAFSMEEEMGLSTARYLWDYLCRSGGGGFLLPLSGGVDSSSTAMLVYYMAHKVCELLQPRVLTDDPRLYELMHTRINRTILKNYPQHRATYHASSGTWYGPTEPLTAQKLMYIILHTVNMPTKNNGQEIMDLATNLAQSLGSYHMVAPIGDAFINLKNIVGKVGLGYKSNAQPATIAHERMEIPRYRSSDGDYTENIAIQNIQARLRMVTAYYLAQILPLHRYNQNVLGEDWESFVQERDDIVRNAMLLQRGDVEATDVPFSNRLSRQMADFHQRVVKTRPSSSPYLLVLASSNADEATRGFYTKYDASSADLNPVGSYSKTDLRKYLRWCVDRFRPQFNVIDKILSVTASPELTPPDATGAVQDDEVDIGMTYDDLYWFGLFRKRDKMGPLSIFQRLCHEFLGKIIVVIDPEAKTKTSQAATPTELYKKVKTFFRYYGQQRNKMTILTPAIHATNYSPDDNRFDQRPFLLPGLEYQMKAIEDLATRMEEIPDVQQLIATGQRELERARQREREQSASHSGGYARRDTSAASGRRMAGTPSSPGRRIVGAPSSPGRRGGR